MGRPRTADVVFTSGSGRRHQAVQAGLTLTLLIAASAACSDRARARELKRDNAGASGAPVCCASDFVWGDLADVNRVGAAGSVPITTGINRVEVIRKYTFAGKEWLAVAAQDDGVVDQVDPVSGALQRVFPIPTNVDCTNCAAPSAGPCQESNGVCSQLTNGVCPPGSLPCGGPIANEGHPTGLDLNPSNGDLYSTDVFLGTVHRYPYNSSAPAAGPHFLAPVVVPTLESGSPRALVSPIAIAFLSDTAVLTLGGGGSVGGGLLDLWTLDTDASGNAQLEFVKEIDVSSIHASDVLACGSRVFLSPNDADSIDSCAIWARSPRSIQRC